MKRRQRPKQTSRGTGLRQELQNIADEATAYFNRVASQANRRVSPEDQHLVEELSSKIMRAVAATANAVGSSPLVGNLDRAGLGYAMKGMVAALDFRLYQHWDTYQIHDEDVHKGIVDAGESDDFPLSRDQAQLVFMKNHKKVLGFLDLLEVPEPIEAGGTDAAPTSAPPQFQRRAAALSRSILPVLSG